MGDPTRGERAEPSSRDPKLRREWGQKLEDRNVCANKIKKGKNYLHKKRGGEEERDGVQHDDKRATTVTEIAEGNSSSLPMGADDGCGWEGRRGKSGGGPRRVPRNGLRHHGLQETRRSGQSALLRAGYVVYCSGESGGEGGGKEGQGGVGLAVCKSISRAEARPPEFISDRLLKVTLELCGRPRAVTFVVGYAPTDTQSVGKKNAFWTALESVLKEVPEHEQLFVLMDANARTGRRGGKKLASEECKVLGAYGRDTLNDYGKRLLSFPANHKLALLNTFFSTAKNAISHTFKGRGRKRIDYILTRQRDRKLVRDATVYP